LLGSGKYSIIQDTRKKTSQSYLNNKFKKQNINIVNNLHKRFLNSSNNKCKINEIIQPETFKSSNIHKRILGHLSAVYCICFDRTGKYILTGADDGLIKIWNAFECRLLATLRGHEKEISDIDVNYENTLLVSGSCDKTIRVWNLKTTESIIVLHAHTSMVTSVEFSPYCKSSNRWMASSGNDGVICFWSWNVDTLAFNTKPKKFIEKSRSGAQILCISFSTGGSFMAAGSNDHSIRVYFIDNDVPQKVCELESHSNIVDSIQYANNLPWILSGSKDGTARVWKYEDSQWTAMLIDASKSLNKSDANDEFSALDLYRKTSVTMVTWNCDDSYVITAQNNFLIKVWSSKDGRLIHELKAHTNEVFVLEAHPKDPRLLLSAGHDGNVILWNIQKGKLIKKFYNKIENEGHGCLFDTKWSPLYDTFASTDSHGYLTIFGFGNDDNYKKLPNEQFFHTDYRPLARDSNDYVVDEQTQQAPHLMPPPFLVNADGHPYPVDLQRLVPGRENLTDYELNPTVIVNENGRSEIIGNALDEQNATDEAQQARRRNLYKKNVIRQLEDVLLKTNEEYRLDRLEKEIKYYYTELYKEQLVPKVNVERKPIDNSEEKVTTSKKRGRKRTENRVIRENRVNNSRLLDTDDEEDVDIESSSDSDELTDDEQLDVGDNEHNDLYETNSLQNLHDEDSRGPQTRHSTRLLNGNSNSAQIYHSNDNQDDFLGSADSSDYSDWAEEDGRKTLRPPPTRQIRKERRRRRKLRIRDDEDEEVDVDTEIADEPMKLTRRIRKARVIQDDDDNEDDDDEQPAVEPKKPLSHEVKPTTSHDASVSPKKKRGRKKKEEIEKRLATHINANECPPEFRPPEWITSTKPKKSPYVPQIGDEVVYFRQGHEIYAEAVKQRQTYELDEQSLPWNKQSIGVSYNPFKILYKSVNNCLF
jgi:bromodomain and WD repeat domain containing protein 1/3